MAHSSSIFSRVPIDLPNRSGFDLSHENLGTATCGTLIPVLVDELLPNDTISLGSSFQVQLPPMATDFFGRVDFVLEAFFVPNRLLWGGWESFMTHPTSIPQYPEDTPTEATSKFTPNFYVSSTDMSSGSLSDYLGVKGFVPGDQSEGSATFSALPFLAYHRIWDDWYRDSRIQAPLFYRPDLSSFSNLSEMKVSYFPYVSGGQMAPDVISSKSLDVDDSSYFSDGVTLSDLRQRNWSKDYFTSSSTLPQAGKSSVLEFDTNSAQNNGSFSISALRAANSLQKWMERNNVAGYRYSDQIYAQFGIYPSDAIMDKCIYLGRTVQNVYTRSVFQQGSSGSSNNPFNSVGAKYGSSQAIGQGTLVDGLRVTEHGFLVVLASLVPHAYYSTGVRRYLRRDRVGDYAFPLLSGMGDQAIKVSELCSSVYDTNEDVVFGYTDLYAEYKYHDDEVHGLLRDGSSLSSFALQRGFTEVPKLGSEFLLIPQNYLKQVLAVDSAVSGFDCWYDIFFPYKKISTLPEYSLPTLADLKNVHKGHLSRGGKRL